MKSNVVPRLVLPFIVIVSAFAAAPPAMAAPELSWRERFDQNNGSWSVGDRDDAKMEIKDGFYFITGKKGGLWATREISVERGADHAVGALLRGDSAKADDYAGLIWDFRDGDTYLAFVVTQDGRFGMIRREGGKSTLIDGWKSDPAVKGKGAFNSLEVRREGRDLVFGANGKDLRRMTYTGYAGTKIGIVFSGAQTITVDEMSVRETRVPAGAAAAVSERAETVFSSKFDTREIMNSPVLFGISADFSETGPGGPGYVIRKSRRGTIEIMASKREFDLSRDFSIEMGLGWISGDDNRGYGLVVDEVDGDALWFALSADGYYSIRRTKAVAGKDAAGADIVPWTKSPNVRTYEAPNTLGVFRRGERLSFVLNGRVVHEMPYPGFRSAELGFGCDGTMQFKPLSLRISHEPVTEGPILGDCRQGYGVFRFADGSRHVGFWADGRPEGPGTRYLADGSIQDGIWKRGALAAGPRVAGAPADEAAPLWFPVAKKSQDWGLVDVKGAVQGFGLKGLLAADRPLSGPLPVSDGSRTGFVPTPGASGTTGAAAIFSNELNLTGGFSDGYALVRGTGSGAGGGGIGIIDAAGKVTVKPGAWDIDAQAGIQAGLVHIRAEVGGKTLAGLLTVGGQVVRKPDLAEIGEFSYGLARAKTPGGRWGYIDRSGIWRLPPRYDVAGDFSAAGITYVLREGAIPIGETLNHKGSPRGLMITSRMAHPYRFSEGLAPFWDKSGGLGFMDEGAKTVVNPGSWVEAKPFSEGLAALRKSGSGWGFVDRSGTLVIPEQYEQVLPFGMGLAAAKKGGLWGYLDQKGAWAIPPAFAEAYSFRAPGLAQVKTKEGLLTWIDRSGAQLWTGEVALVIVGVEEFEDNERDWPILNTKTISTAIKKGRYLITAKTANGGAIAKAWGFERTDDYAIEATLRFEGKAEDDLASFIWELRDWENHYYFNISRQGLFSVTKVEGGTPSTLVDWTASDRIDRGTGDTRVGVRRRDDRLEFSIGGAVVADLPLESFGGEALGFYVSDKAAISVDSVVLRMTGED